MSAANASVGIRAERGFTLREIVITLIVLGIISAIALPRMNNDPMLLASQAERLAGDLRYVQSISMSQGQRYLLKVIPPSTYELEVKGGAQVPHPSGTPSPLVLSNGITVSAIPTDFIGFDGQGVPYTDVNVSTLLASGATATITLSLNGQTRSIVVSSETGRVIVQ